jgi:hypothetical protein
MHITIYQIKLLNTWQFATCKCKGILQKTQEPNKHIIKTSTIIAFNKAKTSLITSFKQILSSKDLTKGGIKADCKTLNVWFYKGLF